MKSKRVTGAKRSRTTKAKPRCAPADGSALLAWILDNLHLLEVNIDAAYCETQKTPSASFRSLTYHRGGRPWSVKGEQRERLLAALEREMNHKHEWHPVTRYPGGWRDVCVTCGQHRDVPNDKIQP